jgi:hypothetical protein
LSAQCKGRKVKDDAIELTIVTNQAPESYSLRSFDDSQFSSKMHVYMKEAQLEKRRNG